MESLGVVRREGQLIPDRLGSHHRLHTRRGMHTVKLGRYRPAVSAAAFRPNVASALRIGWGRRWCRTLQVGSSRGRRRTGCQPLGPDNLLPLAGLLQRPGCVLLTLLPPLRYQLPHARLLAGHLEPLDRQQPVLHVPDHVRPNRNYLGHAPGHVGHAPDREETRTAVE